MPLLMIDSANKHTHSSYWTMLMFKTNMFKTKINYSKTTWQGLYWRFDDSSLNWSTSNSYSFVWIFEKIQDI